MLNPEIVTAIGLMLLFISMPMLDKGYMTMLIAHITFCTPYVILTVLPKLRSLDPSIAMRLWIWVQHPLQSTTQSNSATTNTKQ
ncbi:hypothetical protein MGH68_18920 [Erysipelothrix sp. D19-032]